MPNFKSIHIKVFFLSITFSVNLFAQEIVVDDKAIVSDEYKTCEGDDCKGKWHSSIEMGYVSISGNTDSKTQNSQFAVSYEEEKWRHEGIFSKQKSFSHDKLTNIETTAQKRAALIKSNYKFGKNAYVFGLIDYDKTENSGFVYQSSMIVGSGYRFINSDEHILDAELGYGQRKSETEITFIENEEDISRFAMNYSWKMSKTSSFEQKFSSEAGSDNTITKSYSGVSAKIFDNLALKFSYSQKHQSDVPLGYEKTEKITSFTLVYLFNL
ncbi:MAG: DUF481 domain-containing protein [Gammaproteobacteria bacterium]|nr:DUF481 domain-containing protein [Gammaproteobacteria bacterium]